MRRALAALLPAFLGLVSAKGAVPGAERDALLSALRAELDRSVARLHLENAAKPYFIEYAVEDGDGFRVEASFGALLRSDRDRFRQLRTEVRVGSYERDSSEFLGPPTFGRGSFPHSLVLEDDEAALRHDIWLATDEAYKAALEQLARKNAALQNRVEPEPVADFSREKPTAAIVPRRPPPGDPGAWADRVRRLSAVFREFPAIQESAVSLSVQVKHRYVVNSEGTFCRQPSALALLRVRASTQAADGMPLRHLLTFAETDPDGLPKEADLMAAVRRTAGELTSLAAAPILDKYVGPVLVTGQAAGEVFAEVFGPQLSGQRPPVFADERMGASFPKSDLADRLGRGVLPAFLSVVDDPTRTRFGEETLVGAYTIDEQGVPSRAETLVEKGVLKSLLMTRRPRKEILQSNGHARGGGSSGPRVQIGNLFIRASEGKSFEELKQELFSQCRAQGLSFGLLIRTFGAPSTPGFDPDMFAAFPQAGRPSPLGPPVLAWKVTPDGKEELVRGLTLGDLTVKTLREISAAGSDSYVYNRMAGNVPTSIVTPSLLFPELELKRSAGAQQKPALLTHPFFDKAGKGR
jgi:predicted Zn-dependent protease